jgi:glucose/arabinose dehydrogenase
MIDRRHLFRHAALALGLSALVLGLLIGARAIVAQPNSAARAYLPLAARAPSLVVVPVGSGFSQATAITHAGDDRLFIGQRTGEIWVMEPGATPRPFLDLSDRVTAAGSEYGLYDIAFHPDFAANGLFFVTYTTRNDGRVYLVLARYWLSPGADVPEADSEAVLLRVRQDTDLHKGGGLDFDRRDHWLYLGIGEDTQRALAQDPRSLKGKVLRLAVDDVPPDLTGNAEGRARREMWALGFRNPWRVDVDEPTGLIYVADVGSGSWEEVNVAPAAEPGANFGWPCREGPDLFPPGNDVPACLTNPTLTDPLFAFSHDDGRCAIIGGSVYRPQHNPSDGRYVFGELCTRQLYALPTGTAAADPTVPLGIISNAALLTLGEDSAGNLYAGDSRSNGPILQLILP